MPARIFSISPARWLEVAVPDEAIDSMPGFAFASATSSATAFAGTDGCTSSTFGIDTTCATGAKSPGAYGSFGKIA